MSNTTAVMGNTSEEASGMTASQIVSSEHSSLKVPEVINYRDYPKTKLCYFYPRVPCKNGDNCKFIHSDLPRPPKVKKDKEQKRRDKEEKERRRLLEASGTASPQVEEVSGDSEECVASKSSVSMALSLVEPPPVNPPQQEKPAKLSKLNMKRDASRRRDKPGSTHYSKRSLVTMNASADALSQLEYIYAMNLLRAQYEAALAQQQAVQYAALVPMPDGAMGAVYFQYGSGQSVCPYYHDHPTEANEAPCYCSYCVMYLHACRHQHFPPPRLSHGSGTLVWI